MGAGTGMVLIGQELFVGSFAGDRIFRWHSINATRRATTAAAAGGKR